MPLSQHDRERLPDCAAAPDARALPIDQVGIRGLRYPITVWDRACSRQATVAELSLSVGLPGELKGTHMSRFIEILNGHRGELSLGTVPDVLAEIQRRLGAEVAWLTADFPYFLERRAPVSGAPSLMDYQCRFAAARRGEALDFVLGVRIPVTTLCPCSKAVSRYGAHNQRGLVDVSLRFDGMVWIEDVVEAVEARASSPLYALLKREDEKYVTERAYENPRFVEDLLREVVLGLRALPGVTWVEVEVENLESIHNHSAWGRLTWPHDNSGPRPAPVGAAPVGAGPGSAAPPGAAPEVQPFGAWLREQREARRLSQQALAEAIGVSSSLLSRVERGEKNLSPEALTRLAAALGCAADKLMLKAGVLSPALLAAIQADPEGFLRWAAPGREPYSSASRL